MNEPVEVANMLAQVKAGDQHAATDLFHRFAKRLVNLARSRLDLRLQRKIDPEDVVQSVFGSFFRRNDAGEFNIQSWDNLWSLLALITVHKCGLQVRFYRAAKRAVGSEQSHVELVEESSAHWDFIARDPSPSHAAMLTEALEQLMRSLEESERQILVMSLQGYSVEEISEQVGRSERTVHRVLQRIREQLEGQIDHR